MRNAKKLSESSTPSAKQSKGSGGSGRVKSMKHTGNQACPLKVVHISNPMKVKVSPAEFRGLVQELTGRHALDWSHHPRWNNSFSDFTLDPLGLPPLTPPAHQNDDVEDQGNCLDAVVVADGCCFGSDLTFCGDDHEDFMSSLYV